MKLNIKKTEKTFVNLINASNKNDSSRFDACCYIIEIVVRYGLTSKALESHLVTALDNVTKGKHYDCLNYSTLKRLKSLCCNKNMIKEIKKDNPKSVKSFLAKYNIDTQNLLQTACYSNGAFSNDEVKEKDTIYGSRRFDERGNDSSILMGLPHIGYSVGFFQLWHSSEKNRYTDPGYKNVEGDVEHDRSFKKRNRKARL